MLQADGASSSCNHGCAGAEIVKTGGTQSPTTHTEADLVGAPPEVPAEEAEVPRGEAAGMAVAGVQ